MACPADECNEPNWSLASDKDLTDPFGMYIFKGLSEIREQDVGIFGISRVSRWQFFSVLAFQSSFNFITTSKMQNRIKALWYATAQMVEDFTYNHLCFCKCSSMFP